MIRQSTIRKSRLPAWLNAAVLLIASFVFIAALSFQVHPDTEVVAVAFPPWWTSQRAFLAAASADAALVRMTALPSVLVVRLGRPDGWARLREAGAWFALDPQAIAACL
jgi:hypothetical protein